MENFHKPTQKNSINMIAKDSVELGHDESSSTGSEAYKAHIDPLEEVVRTNLSIHLESNIENEDT